MRFREKGGKQREIPVRHDLDGWIDAYLEAGKIDLSQKAAPLFLAADRWGLGLVDRALTAHGVRRMLKRRLVDAGLPEIITPHSFRVMVVTDLLGQNVPMEDVQYLAGHSNPRLPRSMTVGAGASPATSSSASRCKERPLRVAPRIVRISLLSG